MPPPVDAGEVLRQRYRNRLPARLEDLTRPVDGTIDLLLHLVRSGRSRYTLDQLKARMSLYRTVLAEGQREDMVTFPNTDLLVVQWPVLRRLVSRFVCEVWEERFPELAALQEKVQDGKPQA